MTVRLPPAGDLAEHVGVAAADRSDPVAFLRIREVLGGLAEEPRFRDAFTESLDRLRTSGVRPRQDVSD